MLLENVIRKRLFWYGTKNPLLMLSEKAFSSKTFSNLCWVEYYSWRTRVFYSSMYLTQHTHSLSTAFHTLLNILIAWVPLSILDSKYSKLEYRFPYSTRVWVRYRANTQRWVEYRVWLSILDSKYSKLEYNFPYSTQNTQSLSTTSHTRLNILIAWVQLSILYSSMSTVSGKYSTMSRVSSMTFHTRLKILKAWVWLSILDSKYSILYSSLSTCLRLRDVILRGILYPDIV